MSLGPMPSGSSPGSIPKVLSEAEKAPPLLGLRLALAAGALVAMALVGSVLLWAHYGTTVFFETIRAGFAACFG
ncbi:MAG TPA: hypothetical protein VK825_02840 [Xanthobacteraceae bacterium]|jgi:hypothetical protein|nr:hypothetical protein [Xanthobacteraceae bacterium]